MTTTNRLLKKEYLQAQADARVAQITSNDRQIRIMRKLRKPVPATVTRWQKLMSLRARIEREIQPTLNAIREARADIFHEPYIVRA